MGSVGVAPIPNATPSQAAGVAPHSIRELQAAPGAQVNEAQPVELPQPARPGGKAVKPASAPLPSTGPDPAVLERAAEILRQIQLHVAPGVRRLTLDLEPAELGRLSVQLALRAGKVAAIVRGERPETLELLQQREADLLQVLAQRGIEVDAVRFELGFRGSRSKRAKSPGADTAAAPSGPTRSLPSTAPGDRSARIDLYA
jgi:flagellar hook-length control protein FliK